MEYFEEMVDVLDAILDTKRKRRITGGLLLSLSVFFGGLAVTVLSISKEEEKANEDEE